MSTCNPRSSNYSAEPDEITQPQSPATNATAGCCSFKFTKSGLFSSTGKLQQFAADGVTPNGERDKPWKGEVVVESDGTRGTVTVSHRLKALNRTTDTARYHGTTEVTDADLATMLAKIPPAIERAWNAKPYRLKITDTKCGEQLFNVRFTVSMVTSNEHFTLDFVNVPGMGTVYEPRGVTSGRSYILPPDRGKFNLGDSRTAADGGDSCLEPHEFGHMIGLIDEYTDLELKRNGVRYDFPDGTRETVGASSELMGTMSTRTAQKSRYCVTIAYAAIALLEANGHPVTDCVIL